MRMQKSRTSSSTGCPLRRGFCAVAALRSLRLQEEEEGESRFGSSAGAVREDGERIADTTLNSPSRIERR